MLFYAIFFALSYLFSADNHKYLAKTCTTSD